MIETFMAPQEFKSKPYAHRRVLIVAPMGKSDFARSSVDWMSLASLGVAGTWAAGATLGLGTIVGVLLGPVVLGGAAVAGILGLLGAPRQVPPGTIVVPFNFANDHLSFPPGHPQPEFAYIGHPLIPDRYIPVASFHNVIFEEHVNELTNLLAALGATRIKIRCREGFRATSSVAFTVSSRSGGVGASGGTKDETSRDAEVEESYSPEGEPKVPSDLLWFSHEPSWAALAKRRLDFATRTFALHLLYKEDFGVNADLETKLSGLRLKLGGKFTEFKTTDWEFEGDFTPTKANKA